MEIRAQVNIVVVMASDAEHGEQKLHGTAMVEITFLMASICHHVYRVADIFLYFAITI